MLATSEAILAAWLSPARQLAVRVKVGQSSYGSEDVTSLSFDSGSISGEVYQIGSTYMNTVQIAFPSIIETIKEDQEVIPELGILVDGEYHYSKLGHFFITEFNRDRNAKTTTITASDKMIYMEGTYESKLTYSKPYREVALEIANLAGVEVNQASFASLGTGGIQKPVGYTYRQAIGLIAQFEGGFASFNRDGELEIRRLRPTEFEVTPESYLLKGFTKNENAYRIGGITVRTGEEESDVLRVGSANGSQIELENKVMTQTLLNNIWDLVKNLNYFPFELKWRGCPSLEAGDWMYVHDRDGNRYSVPNLSYSLSFNGGLSGESKATTNSSSQATYKYRGTLSQKVEYLDNLLSSNGWNQNYYDTTEPKNPKEGDIWFKQNGQDKEIWIYEKDEEGNLSWVLQVSTATDPELIQAIEEVGEKVEQAQSNADKALAGANDAVDKANQAAAKADASGQAAQLAIEQSANAVTQAQQAIKDAADLLDDVTELAGTVSDITVDINTINKSLAVKVDQTEFDKLEGTVTNQSTLIEANAQAITQKASQTSVDTLNDTVESVQSQLTVEAGKISALNTLTDEHTTQIGSLESSYSGLSSTISEVENRFTDGNNLVTDGDFESGVNRGIALYQSLDSYPTPSGNYAARLYVNGTAGTEYTRQWNLPTPITLLANVEYTIEYDYSVAGTARGVASDYARDENSNWISGIMMEKSQHTVTGGQGVWKKFVNTFKLTQDTVLTRFRFGFVLNGDGVGWKVIDNIKIYQGASIVTQFSNLTQEVDTIQATVASNDANTQAQLIVLSNQITSTVGQMRDGNNLVDDGGFESGNGRGLSLIGQTDTYPTPSGNYMARLIKTGGTASEDYYQIWTLPTPVTLLANTEYTIEYDYSVAGTARGNASDYIRDSAGVWISNIMMDHASHTLTGGQGVWKKYTKTFSLDAETTVTDLRFGFVLNGDGVGWKVIDNIKIYQGVSTQSQITQLSDRMNFRITNSDGSVTQIDLANKVISLAGDQVNITGNTYIENGVVKTAAIADAAITNAKIGNISANKVTTGELNAANVNIINLNASNIVTGELTGITIKSAANGSLFRVRGNDLYMQKSNGDNLTMSTSGIYWYDSTGEILFQSSKKLTTSDIFGTAEYNAYLAAFNETRSVTYASALKGTGAVSDYTYVPHRASKIFANQLEVNTGVGNPTHLYLKTSSAEADVRVAVAGDGDVSYARLRAGALLGNWLSVNTQTDAVNLYLQSKDEVRIVGTGTGNLTNNATYLKLRASKLYANSLSVNDFTSGKMLYLQAYDEVRVKNVGDSAADTAYMPIRASAFNTSSLAEYKTNIQPFEQSALDLIKASTVYEYNLKSDLATQEIGLVIGDGYDIADIVVNGDGVSQYRMNSLAWKAIQELNQKIETLEQEIRVLQAA